MHRFDWDFFGGFLSFLFRLTSTLELSGISPINCQSGISPISSQSGISPIS
jgi:hypothetical protein